MDRSVKGLEGLAKKGRVAPGPHVPGRARPDRQRRPRNADRCRTCWPPPPRPGPVRASAPQDALPGTAPALPPLLWGRSKRHAARCKGLAGPHTPGSALPTTFLREERGRKWACDSTHSEEKLARGGEPAAEERPHSDRACEAPAATISSKQKGARRAADRLDSAVCKPARPPGPTR